jgi:uncharacterized surface anchored protein
MTGRRATARRLAVAAMVTGLMLVVLANVAGADEGTGSDDVGVTATSVAGGLTVTWAGNGVTNGVCDTNNSDLLTPIPDNKTGWLFVLNSVSPDPSGNNGADWAMQATFDVGGTVDGTVVQTNSSVIKWAVYAPIGAKLTAAQAFGPVGASAGVFTVSHCAEGAVVTTTSTSTSTSTSTTTTTEVSPSSVTNATVPPSVEAEAAAQGLPRTGSGLSLPLLFAGVGLTLGGAILLFASRRMAAQSIE